MRAERELRALWNVPMIRGDLNLSEPEPSIRSKGTETAQNSAIWKLERCERTYVVPGLLPIAMGTR